MNKVRKTARKLKKSSDGRKSKKKGSTRSRESGSAKTKGMAEVKLKQGQA